VAEYGAINDAVKIAVSIAETSVNKPIDVNQCDESPRQKQFRSKIRQ
jgi:hypothetical protein